MPMPVHSKQLKCWLTTTIYIVRDSIKKTWIRKCLFPVGQIARAFGMNLNVVGSTPLWGQTWFCLKMIDSFSRTSIRQSKLNGVARAKLIAQTLILQRKVSYSISLTIDSRQLKNQTLIPQIIFINIVTKICTSNLIRKCCRTDVIIEPGDWWFAISILLFRKLSRDWNSVGYYNSTCSLIHISVFIGLFWKITLKMLVNWQEFSHLVSYVLGT